MNVLAHDYQSSRPDGHAPISVMGDHTHGQGEFMFSYRYMKMDMDGLQDGSDEISTEEFFASTRFMVAPTNMAMDMHMFGLMYAPTNNLTLLTMLNYIENSMDHVTRMGGSFTTETSGIGDVQLGGLFNIIRNSNSRTHINFGLSLPTGSIDERGNTPMGNVVLPYPMQLGTGTYDVSVGLTHNVQWQALSFGTQWISIFRLGENDRDYTVGNKHEIQSWVARPLSEMFSISANLDWMKQENYDGADPALDPALVPTADPSLRGGMRLDLGVGVNFIEPRSGHRLAVEFLTPINQDLDGPQLKTENTLVLGWQLAI